MKKNYVRSAMMLLETTIKGYINSQLRRIFKWSKSYKDCKARARVEGNIYRCEGCTDLIDKNGLDSRLELVSVSGAIERIWADKLHVDHINPFVPLSGWLNDQDYAKNAIMRMFPSSEGVQYLCGACHYFKTQIENDIRRKNKKEIEDAKRFRDLIGELEEIKDEHNKGIK